jgi:Secretion system C-terminal sorting domain
MKKLIILSVVFFVCQNLNAVETVTFFDQPEDIHDCLGVDGHLFSVVAGVSAGDIQYQWKRDGIDLIQGTDFELSTTKGALILGELEYEMSGVYTCDVWSDIDGRAGAVSSDSVLLNVIQTTSITRPPVNALADYGETVAFTFGANIFGKDKNDYPVEIQWYRNEVAIEDGGRFSGARTNYLIVSEVNASDYIAQYKVVITGRCGSVESDNVSVIDYTGVEIIDFTATSGDCEGDEIEMVVTATNGGSSDDDLTYRWTAGGIPVGDDSNTYTYILTTTPVEVKCIVKNSVSFKTDAISGFYSGILKNGFITEPIGEVLTEGDPLVLFVEAKGSNLTYEWIFGKRNIFAVSIPGANSATLSIDTTTTDDTGVYRCIIYGDCGGSRVSDMAFVLVNRSSVISSVDANENVFNLNSFPNPSYDGSTLINFNLGTVREARLNIVDAFGNIVLSTEVSGNSYSLSGLNSGSYFYILTAGENSVTKKMVIIK